MDRLLLTNANLFDGSAPVAGSTVVVEDDRVLEVHAGAAGAPAANGGERVIDLGGRTLMPGMTITHFHSTYAELGAITAPFGLDHPIPYQTIQASRAFGAALRCGYTGVVSAGAAHDIDASLAAAIEDGLIPGPRVLPCSREMSTTGHANDWAPWWWGVTAMGATRVCNGPEQFREGVREEIKRGARMIKLYITGGHGVRSPASQMEMARDEVAAAIETAHSRGVQVRAHIANRDAIMMALDLGIDVIDHGDGMDESAMRAVVDAGVFVVPSLHFLETLITRFPPGSPTAASMQRDLATGWEALMMMHEGGVRLTVGDDYGAKGFAHGSYNNELVSYVKNTTIPAIDVLRWATRNGAELMRRGDDFGTIAAGKLADLVVIDGDPVDDIAVLADTDNIIAVLKSGQVVAGALPS
jgi:imidazolonepropionase-like amidohydrolase